MFIVILKNILHLHEIDVRSVMAGTVLFAGIVDFFKTRCIKLKGFKAIFGRNNFDKFLYCVFISFKVGKYHNKLIKIFTGLFSPF